MAPPSRSPLFLGVAWPYANGPLHLGHVAGSLLPPDIFARYARMAGHPVLMVSGSDCHGTPIMIQAEKEGTTPEAVVARFHADHRRALERLGIAFDLFTTTTTANHREWVQRILKDAMAAGFIEARTAKAPYDPAGKRFLPDRYVEGTCPHCGAQGARGDQCDACGKTLDPQELKDPRSKLNPGTPIEFRDTEHLFLLLSKLQAPLEAYVRAHAGHWRPNTVHFTEGWLKDGLQDRAITRDLSWGVPVPIPGYQDKRVYVWFEAVCGYLSAAVEWAQKSGHPQAWRTFWENPECRPYYFLGKDNIPFHTIVWPAILMAENQARKARGEVPLNLPFEVAANEFLNLAGLKFSKSQGVGIGVHEVLDRFEANSVRYYLSINMPEGRDSDWAWPDFLSKVNDELVGNLGNFLHRVVSFTHNFVGQVPVPSPDEFDAEIEKEVRQAFEDVTRELAAVRLRPAVRRIMELASRGNERMQQAQPWALWKTDRKAAEGRLYSLLRVCKALTVMMAPYLPDAAQASWEQLGQKGQVAKASWEEALVPLLPATPLGEPHPLFRKLDPAEIPGAAAPAEAKPAAPTAAAAATGGAPATVTIDEFARIDLRVALVKEASPHPKADKLYVLKLDVGALGERQVVAGLRAHYKAEELVGRRVAFVANLAPARLRGVESQGMVLAGDDGAHVALLSPLSELAPGSKIR
ncbi:MAG: methionine--tRNA ligase [Thermoplasmatota archaeon]